MKKQLAPYGWLVLGIVAVIWGISQLTSAGTDCGGQQMRQGDQCIETGSGGTTTRSVDQQHKADRAQGIIGVIVGALLIGGSGYTLYRRARPADPHAGEARRMAKTASSRAELAREHGWTYQQGPASVLRGWTIGRLEGHGIAGARDAITGTIGETPFAVFDVPYVSKYTGPGVATYWFVRLPSPGPYVRIDRRTSEDRKRPPLGNGDPDFDRTYKALTDNPAAARRLLTADVTRLIRQHDLARLTLEFTGEALVYTGRHSDRKPEAVVRVLQAMAGVASAIS